MNKDKNIETHFPKDTGYSVPGGYFDELPERITSRLGFDNVDVNDVPETYFKDLPDRIMESIDVEEKPVLVIHPLSRWIKYAGIAASLVLAVVMFDHLRSGNEQVPEILVSDDLILEYLNEYNENIDASALSEIELIRNEFNLIDVVGESDELYEYYLEYYLDDVPSDDLEEILK